MHSFHIRKKVKVFKQHLVNRCLQRRVSQNPQGTCPEVAQIVPATLLSFFGEIVQNEKSDFDTSQSKYLRSTDQISFKGDFVESHQEASSKNKAQNGGTDEKLACAEFHFTLIGIIRAHEHFWRICQINQGLFNCGEILWCIVEQRLPSHTHTHTQATTAPPHPNHSWGSI